VRHAGLYAATIALPGSHDLDDEMFMLNTPGKLVALHPCQGKPLAFFAFWHPEIPEYDYMNLDQHKGILERTFAGMGWRVPEFLDAVRAAHRETRAPSSPCRQKSSRECPCVDRG